MRKLTQMLSFSNAKINLGLNIIGKRADGYHNIESVFYPVTWADVLEIIPSPNFSFSSSGLPVPGKEEDNLIIKAFGLLRDSGKFPKDQSVSIYLHKILPMGAGIGGGSSNAAYTLKLINEVLNLGLSAFELEAFAEKLGSDCPFFIQNKPRFCHGKGTDFEDISISLKEKYIIMVNPGIHVSTQEAYSGITPQKPLMSIKDVIQKPIIEWKEHLINDFEAPVSKKHPLIGELKTILYKNGALYSSMTGSGSTVYGIFDTETDLNSIFNEFTYWAGYLN